jgi:Cu-processing system permease protein
VTSAAWPVLFRNAIGAWRGALLLALGIAVAGDLFLRLTADVSTAYASLLDVVLIVTPLLGLVLGTSRMHRSRDVVELMLAQPVSRHRVFFLLWWQGSLPLATGLALGVLAPFAWQGSLWRDDFLMPGLLACGAAALALISQACAMIIALRVNDRVRAHGVALVTWLLAAVLWDGAVLVIALLYGSHPIEMPLLVMLALNPVDLVRVALLIGSDAAAMMGYTGAVVTNLLGSTAGRVAIGVVLGAWLVVPTWVAARTFGRKDF